jgi:PhoH-like ATPase
MPDKTFVLDTNVLVHNPNAIFLFETNKVVIPLVVIEELDNLKKFMDERGRNARTVSRHLDELRQDGGDLSRGVPLPNGGSLRVELSMNGPLPPALDSDKADNSILRTAIMLQKQGEDVRFISKDINARIKADALGIQAEDFENAKVDIETLYRGWAELSVDTSLVDAFYRERRLPAAHLGEGPWYPNQFVLLRAAGMPNHSALGRINDKGECLPLAWGEKDAWGVRALNVEQKFAMDLLLDDAVELVTLVGSAGTGKTLLAMAAGLQRVVEEKRYRKVLISRPVIPLGKDIGYLPGSKDEKLRNWMQPIFDNLDFLTGQGDDDGGDHVDYLMETNKLELEAVTYIRGRSLPRQWMIVDEAQNLTPHEMKTIVSRAGEGTKVVITGDPYQIDNPYLDSDSNGLTYLVEKFKGQPLYGHVTLSRTERSKLAAMAAKIL